MYQIQVNEINKKLKNNKKAIIAIGCSFVQGQGAVDDELYQDIRLGKYHEGRAAYNTAYCLNTANDCNRKVILEALK